MIWAFPIAGYGTRTSKYGKYKPFIPVFKNYPIIKMCLMGLLSSMAKEDKLVFITSSEQEKTYNVIDTIRLVLIELQIDNEFEIIVIDKTPAGQALTIEQGIAKSKIVKSEDNIMVINSDQMVFFDMNQVDMETCSVGVYFNDSSSSCFYNLSLESNKVVSIKEKTKISHYASSGVFYFNSILNLQDSINWAKQNNKQYNGELYLGPCMEYFDNLSFFKTIVKFDLGNISKIDLFKKFWKPIFMTKDI
jgi:hypothetical protein